MVFTNFFYNRTKLRLTAIHESGHAWTYLNLSCGGHIHEVTIESRGNTAGYVFSLVKNKDDLTPEQLKNSIIMSLAGGVAEQIFGYHNNVPTKILEHPYKILDFFKKPHLTTDMESVYQDAEYLISFHHHGLNKQEMNEKLI